MRDLNPVTEQQSPKKMKIEIATAEMMERLGGRCARDARPGLRLFLQGELGAGKTTFVRGFLHGLGYQGKVKSPSYTLVEPYELARFPVYHFDLYRLSEPLELEALGARDYFDEKSVCLIEWPEKASAYLGEPDLMIKIAYLAERRELRIRSYSNLGDRLMAALG